MKEVTPVVASHTCTIRSCPPEAICRRSGDHITTYTMEEVRSVEKELSWCGVIVVGFDERVTADKAGWRDSIVGCVPWQACSKASAKSCMHAKRCCGSLASAFKITVSRAGEIVGSCSCSA